MRTILGVGFLVSMTMLSACGGGGENAPPATPTGSSSGGAAGGPSTTGGAEPQTFAEQVTVGQKLYGENCGSCHGASGEGGGRSPRVVGLDKGALSQDPPATAKTRKTQFKTAQDVFDFAKKEMPPGGGGSLKDWQYWAILAFDLKANGIEMSKKLDASSAKETNLRK